MASFQNAYYVCSCPAEKCDRDCFSYRHMTHTESRADKLRTMSDEELAEKFEEIQLQAVKAYGNDHLLLKGELKKYWLNWLKGEEKNETK